MTATSFGPVTGYTTQNHPSLWQTITTETLIYNPRVYFSRMSSKFNFPAKVRREGKITIPIEVRDQMNLKEGTFVNVSVSKTKWYEMLDWSQMSQTVVNFSALPSDAQNYISSNYTCDSRGTAWRTNDV